MCRVTTADGEHAFLNEEEKKPPSEPASPSDSIPPRAADAGEAVPVLREEELLKLDLAELDRQHEERLKKRKGLSRFLPVGGNELKAYASLLRFVKPYRLALMASFLMALIGAGFLGLQFRILDHGLQQILGGPAGEVHTLPGTDQKIVVRKSTDDSLLPGRQGGKDQEYAVEPYDPSSTDIARINEADRGNRRRGLWLMAAALILFVAVEGGCKYAQGVIAGSVSRKVVMDLRMAMFHHLLSMSARFYQRNHSASLVSRVTHDLNTLGNFMTDSLVRVIRELLSFIALILYIVWQQGAFILAVAVVIGLAIFPLQILSRRARVQFKAGQKGMEGIYRILSEAFTGQRIVKAFGGEKHESRRFERANREYYKSTMRARRMKSLTEPLVQIVGALGTSLLIIVGGEQVLQQSIPPEKFFVMVLALTRAMGSLRMIGKNTTDYQLALSSADRISAMLETRSEIEEKAGAVNLPPFSSEISFEQVQFSHARRPTLRKVTFKVLKGNKVALVGPSGAGKSTLVDLLPRFYDVLGGRITIDGIDIRDVTLSSLRAQIGIVAQETILFHDTVRNNIGYGRSEATPQEVENAARAAHAHEFIMKLPKGYDTEIGERGFKLSGGERQRLSIARALLSNPPILILDEATSSLDSESERLVQEALDRLIQNRTVLVIAHRLATVLDADRIIILDQGRKVEAGTHEELLSRNGLYRRLHELQFQQDDSPPPESVPPAASLKGS